MTLPEPTILQKLVVSVLTLRAGSGVDAPAVAAAARRAYDDLATVLVPLISQAGVEALLARALHLTQREYPSVQAAEQTAEPSGQVSSWLERLGSPRTAIEAAAAMFATFATLLITLIGEPLTMRFLRKAWPDGFSDTRPEGTQ